MPRTFEASRSQAAPQESAALCLMLPTPLSPGTTNHAIQSQLLATTREQPKQWHSVKEEAENHPATQQQATEDFRSPEVPPAQPPPPRAAGR